jgi:hypothetical protein
MVRLHILPIIDITDAFQWYRTKANGFKHRHAICLSFWEIKHKREQTFPIYIDAKWWMAHKFLTPNSVGIGTSWDDFRTSGVSMFSVTSAIVLGLLPTASVPVGIRPAPDPAVNLAAKVADPNTTCALPACNADGQHRCSKCRCTRYCSRAHQRAHWRHHKPSCTDHA